MAQLGAPSALIEQLTQTRVIAVLPVNWPVLTWFCEVSDLMRWRMDGQCLGLDLLQVKAEAVMAERQYTLSQFNGLRVMSKAAARSINKVV
jgi:hypothetical protein